jgi:hypothetical protein
MDVGLRLFLLPGVQIFAKRLCLIPGLAAVLKKTQVSAPGRV